MHKIEITVDKDEVNNYPSSFEYTDKDGKHVKPGQIIEAINIALIDNTFIILPIYIPDDIEKDIKECEDMMNADGHENFITYLYRIKNDSRIGILSVVPEMAVKQ